MKFLLILLIGFVAAIVGWFVGRNSRNAFILDMKQSLEMEKSKLAGAIKPERPDKNKIDKLTSRADQLLQEKNTADRAVERLEAELKQERSDAALLSKEKKELDVKLAEVTEVWQLKLDAAKTERDDILKVRDEEAVEWKRRLEENSDSSLDYVSKLKEKNARIDELNALLVDKQRKMDRLSQKSDKERFSPRPEKRKTDDSSPKKKEPIETSTPKTEVDTKEVNTAIESPTAEPIVEPTTTVADTPAPQNMEVEKTDDLTKIEGIGPKIAAHLINNEVKTYEQMATMKPETLKVILQTGGPSLANHSPDTWPAQSKMAAEGNWDGLKAWQDELDGGKEKA